MMGKIGEEITQKIKSAVKAKLVELGIEVDNELPDYIMVLVANKKTQVQMERDLQLFLGSNTVFFTTWLINVLKKLEGVTVSKKNYKRIEVTSQGGGVVVTKKEEDFDKRRPVKLAQIKVEPGSSEPYPPGESPEPPSPGEGNQSAETSKTGANDEQQSDSSEEETETNSKEGDVGENSESEYPRTPNKSLESEPISYDEDTSQDKLPQTRDELDIKSADKDVESNDDGSEALDTRQRDESSIEKEERSHRNRPKMIFGIREQIDEVMEKTINGNRRPRRDSDVCTDDHDNDRSVSGRRESCDSEVRPQDERRKSVENEFYRDRRKLSDDRFRSSTDYRRSPGYNDRLRDRSPENRRRVYDDSRRSPDFRRRSPDFRRRSPISRRRGEYIRRSPEYRRRSPIGRRRSPEDRRRSPADRRRSPVNRRRSPLDRRRSPDDRRRLYSDRNWHDDNRRSPVDRGRLHIMDAREILKRKNNRRDVSPDHLSSEESHITEKRRKVIASMVHKPDDGREREESVEPQIPSLVRVTSRPVRNEAIQPNKKLLLLAVADAEKSILRKPSSSSTKKRKLSRSEEKTPDRRTSESSNLGYLPPEKIFITLKNNQKLEGRNYGVSREVSAKKLYEDTEITIEDELLYEESYCDYEQDDDNVFNKEEEYVPQPVTGRRIECMKSKLGSEGKCIISLESSPERSCDEWEEMVKKVEAKKASETQSTENKQVPSESLDIHMEERTEDGFEWSRLGPAPVATVKPLALGSVNEEKYKGEAVHKSLERCKFWPSCLSGNCIYFHPSTVCKMFPHCKSGKECLFIHPDCKFGLDCLNPKCSFLHKDLDVKKKVEEIVSPPVLPTGKPSPPLIKCVYFPNCKNLSCKFWHPVKNCKYGRTCARSDCYFFHPTLVLPPKELLTWTSKI